MSPLKSLHLIAKFHIFRYKIVSKSPTFPAFMALLKEKLLVYKAAAVANKTLQKNSKQDGQLSYPCWIVNQWFLARYYYLFFSTAYFSLGLVRILHAPNQILVLVDSNEYVGLI